MKPAPFDYFAPESLEDALARLGQANGDGAVLAGGQTLAPLMALRMATPSVVIDINRIAELRGVSRTADGTRVGATTRQAQIYADPVVAAHVPGLAAATRLVGHHQTRNRGTLGGSISLGEPAAEYPATAVALGAQLEVRSTARSRVIPAEEFYLGPYSTVLEPDEILTGVVFPDWPQGARTVVREVARRPGDFALVGLVLALAVEAGRISRTGVAWFGMGPTPMRGRKVEQALAGLAPGSIDARGLAEIAVSDTEPLDDGHAGAAYRRTVGRTLFAKAIQEALNDGDAR